MNVQTGIDARAPLTGPSSAAAHALRWSASLLVASIWVSAAIFGLYIARFYAGSLSAGIPEQWNAVLPRLYEPQTPLATAGIAVHFVAGAILLLLGPIQLIRRVRERFPRLHRWTGWAYVTSAVLAGLGGLAFIAAKGTIGGPVMSIGFGLYGALTVLAGVQTARHARARRLPGRLERHRAWAIRLFALTIGSWLYRIEYGFWFLIADGTGHLSNFHGPFDAVMAFFFYVPNLAVAELFIRTRRLVGHPAAKIASAAVLAFAAALVILATWNFTRLFWLPGILYMTAPA